MRIYSLVQAEGDAPLKDVYFLGYYEDLDDAFERLKELATLNECQLVYPEDFENDWDRIYAENDYMEMFVEAIDVVPSSK